MDSTAVNTNITIDDFDSLLTYADQAAWTTPDPSKNNYSATGSEWLMGTYHTTSVVNASVSLNFTGPALYIYGASGPDYGSVEVLLDGESTTTSAYVASNASAPFILYSTSALAYAPHTVTLRNLGKQDADAGGDAFLLDFIRTTVQLAPAGAEVKNVTIEETDAQIKFSGMWGNNTSPFFSGGGSTYTNDDGASFELQFSASAIYVLGDKKNDHGLYTVTLNGSSPEIHNGVSGCGGAFGLTCEQQQPTIKYFASNLPAGTHTLKLTNHAGVNQSYFDLDSIVLTVPSVYAPRNLSEAASTSGTGSGSGSSPSSSPPSGSAAGGATVPSGAASRTSPLCGPSALSALMMLFGLFWLTGPLLGVNMQARRR
ncbi:hypothetical protein MKEN_00284000 [Mycena kentingensis (nom. inval.)]|nr:hypothetical protein MKEN_00284000 [Mycena kentingensis (nom. inval.)]